MICELIQRVPRKVTSFFFFQVSCESPDRRLGEENKNVLALYVPDEFVIVTQITGKQIELTFSERLDLMRVRSL